MLPWLLIQLTSSAAAPEVDVPTMICLTDLAIASPTVTGVDVQSPTVTDVNVVAC